MAISTDIYRNAQNDPKHPEILSEVEWEVTSYRFAYRYEIFRMFRPERNGINNFGRKTNKQFCISYKLKLQSRFVE